MNDSTKQIIEDTVNATVPKLKMAGLLKDNRKSAIEKTEELLRNYPTFKKITGKEHTEKLVAAVEEALGTIRNDPYFDIINRFYFNGQSREFIAKEYNTSVTTISRNKTRLLKEISPMLFSEEFIQELFL